MSFSGNISADKFKGNKCRIRCGTVSTCWPLNEPLCIALPHTRCSRVCLPVLLNANCLCNIPSFRQLCLSVLRLARSSFFLRHYKNPYCAAILLLRYRTFICLLCQPDWTAANSWIMSPRRHINSVKFQGCLYLFKSKVSLKRRQKVQMWDQLDCFDKFGSSAFRQLTPLYSPLSVLNLFCYWWAVCSAVHTVLSGFSNRVQ